MLDPSSLKRYRFGRLLRRSPQTRRVITLEQSATSHTGSGHGGSLVREPTHATRCGETVVALTRSAFEKHAHQYCGRTCYQESQNHYYGRQCSSHKKASITAPQVHGYEDTCHHDACPHAEWYKCTDPCSRRTWSKRATHLLPWLLGELLHRYRVRPMPMARWHQNQ